MKTLLFPGAFQAVKNYGNYEGVDIWLNPTPLEKFPSADCYVGHSAGSAFILVHCDSFADRRFIFINPLVKKRSVPSMSRAWIRYFLGEGIRWKRIISVSHWLHGLKLVRQLIDVDFQSAVEKISKGNLIVIRGKNDHWICDEASVDILKENKIHYIEVDAGHDWNENIAQAVKALL